MSSPTPEQVARQRTRRWDRLVALGLALFTCGWLLAVEGRQGIGRDEAQYFRSAERYWGWFEALGKNLAAGTPGASFSRAGIDAFWGDNPEHPVVMKTLYAFSWRLFHRCTCETNRAQHFLPVTGKHVTIPLFPRETTAFRFPAILFAGLGAVLVFFLARQWLGRTAAVVAALLSVAQPHYFFHAQIAAFDAPITVMAVAVGYCYWRSLTSPRWAIAAGVVFGVALGVKHNAWLMPIFLVGHYLWMRRGDLLRRRPRLPPVPAAFVAMLVLGPLVFLAHWPRLWPEPIERTRWYVNRHVQHEHYNFEYLGRNWNNPPTEWDRKLVRMTFPFVSTAFTVPATTLVLAGVGTALLVRRARRRRGEVDDGTLDEAPSTPGPASWLRPGAGLDRAPDVFLAVQILGPLAVVAVPSVPIFGGVKHFMPAMPYLAVLAGIGYRWFARALAGLLADRRLERAAPVALAGLVALPAVVETRRSHPDGLSHYNLFAGGFAGGASLGMNRQFWGYSVMPAFPWIVANLPPGGLIYWHDVYADALRYYRRDGRLPAGMHDGFGDQAIPPSQMAIVIHERHFLIYEALIWQAYGSTRTAHVREREGVPLVNIYRRWDLPPNPPAVPNPEKPGSP